MTIKLIKDRWKRKDLKTCPNCGFDRIRKEDNFCMMCGIDVREDKRKAPTKRIVKSVGANQ